MQSYGSIINTRHTHRSANRASFSVKLIVVLTTCAFLLLVSTFKQSNAGNQAGTQSSKSYAENAFESITMLLGNKPGVSIAAQSITAPSIAYTFPPSTSKTPTSQTPTISPSFVPTMTAVPTITPTTSPRPTYPPTASPSTPPTAHPSSGPTTFLRTDTGHPTYTPSSGVDMPTPSPTDVPSQEFQHVSNTSAPTSNFTTPHPTWHPTRDPTSPPTPYPTTSRHPTLKPIYPNPTPRTVATPTLKPTNKPINAPVSSPTIHTYSTGIELFKRTHFSTDTEQDARFLSDVLGFDILTNLTFEKAGKFCASRTEMGPTGYGEINFQYHMFSSRVTHGGTVSTKAWVEYFSGLHSKSIDGHSWDAFMSNSVTFFTTDLTPHLTRMESLEIPNMRVKYTSDIDGETIYSILLAVPNTGHIIELISDTVESKSSSRFGSWPKNSCREANKIGFSVSEMRSAWHRSGGSSDNTHNLPTLLTVKVSFPVESASEFGVWFDTKNLEIVERKTMQSEEGEDNIACEYATIVVKQAGSTASDAFAQVRVVSNPSARVGRYTVADWSAYALEAHTTYTGTNGKGWDRYLDNHIGFYYEDSYVEDLLYGLQKKMIVNYHAHKISDSREGSIWTGGFSGQGFEFRGAFSPRYVEENGLSTFDYCSATTDWSG